MLARMLTRESPGRVQKSLGFGFISGWDSMKETGSMRIFGLTGKT
jgi:hypothetical protein